MIVVYLVLLVVSVFKKTVSAFLDYRSLFISGVFVFLTALNLLTSKFAILLVLYFPSLDRVFGVLVEERALLAKCISYSSRLLFTGYFGGALVGLTTGILIGFSKKFSYWVSPLVRVIGPIPSTAWIPLVLIIFPSAVSASAFLVGLAVWFPTNLMTSSGIANVAQAYFEVGSTLGANSFQRIFRIGVPAAMPHIFLGLFNGACASFITLVTAEMIGAKYGIGWYINWQKDMLSYANVYAGLIVIATLFTIIITLLFKVRDRVLGWQKGMIKW
jgi:NitT/TauT family transport system permease protein